MHLNGIISILKLNNYYFIILYIPLYYTQNQNLPYSSSSPGSLTSSGRPPPPPPAPPVSSNATGIPSYIPIKKDSSLDKLDAPSSPPKLKKNFFEGFRNTLRPRLKAGQDESGDGSEGFVTSPRQESKDDSYHRRWSESSSPTKAVRTSSSFIN